MQTSTTGRGRGTADVVNERSEPVVVRASPVDPPAVRAHPEVVEVSPGSKRKAVLHQLFGNRLEHAVALEAPAEGGDDPEQVEPAQDLEDLAPPVGLPHVVATGERCALQQATVAGEQLPGFIHRDRRQVFVGRICSDLIQRIELS